MTFLPRWLAIAGLLSIAGACSPTRAPQGVLVGLASGRTIWIAWPNDSARIVTEKPHLLVPRDDGMWWAGVVTRCAVESGGGGWVEDTIFIGRVDRVFVGRAGEEVTVDLDGKTCDDAEREVLDLRTRARKEKPRDSTAVEDEPLNPETFYCTVYSRRITFASPNALSIEARNSDTEFCNPARYSTSGANIVTQFTSPTRLPLRPLLPPDVSARMDSFFIDTEGLVYFADDPAASIDSTWGMRRQEGGWSARIWIDGPIVARGGQETEEGPLLPQSFTGDAPLPIAWPELVRRVPRLSDAFASPMGDYMLVQQADSLLLFRVKDKQLGPPLFRAHIGYEELAMVRWATPSEARRWNATLPTLEPPRVRVVSSPREF